VWIDPVMAQEMITCFELMSLFLPYLIPAFPRNRRCGSYKSLVAKRFIKKEPTIL